MTAKWADEIQRKIDKSIEHYLSKLEEADQDNSNEISLDKDKEQVEKALNELRKRRVRTQKLAEKLEQEKQVQYCSTEPEAKIMRSGREGNISL